MVLEDDDIRRILMDIRLQGYIRSKYSSKEEDKIYKLLYKKNLIRMTGGQNPSRLCRLTNKGKAMCAKLETEDLHQDGKMVSIYFTFPAEHIFRGRYIELVLPKKSPLIYERNIDAPNRARAIMCRHFGNKWETSYSTKMDMLRYCEAVHVMTIIDDGESPARYTYEKII